MQSPSHMVVKMAENGAFLPFTPFDMCPSIHSLPPFAIVIVVSDGNETATALLQQGVRRDSLRIPRISVPPQNSPAAAAHSLFGP